MLIVADDSPNEAKAAAAAAVGAELIGQSRRASRSTLWSRPRHRLPGPRRARDAPSRLPRRSAIGKPIRTEIDLAYEWEQERNGGPRPMLAVTGTDGKTTTTMMAAAMLQCAGVKAAAVGNTETAVDRRARHRSRRVRGRVQQLPTELDRPLPQ